MGMGLELCGCGKKNQEEEETHTKQDTQINQSTPLTNIETPSSSPLTTQNTQNPNIDDLILIDRAILIGKGNPKKPIAGMAIGVAVKTIIEFFTLKKPEIGIYGAAIGSIACYFIANLINLSMVFPIKSKRKKNESLSAQGRRYADY